MHPTTAGYRSIQVDIVFVGGVTANQGELQSGPLRLRTGWQTFEIEGEARQAGRRMLVRLRFRQRPARCRSLDEQLDMRRLRLQHVDDNPVAVAPNLADAERSSADLSRLRHRVQRA